MLRQFILCPNTVKSTPTVEFAAGSAALPALLALFSVHPEPLGPVAFSALPPLGATPGGPPVTQTNREKLDTISKPNADGGY